MYQNILILNKNLILKWNIKQINVKINLQIVIYVHTVFHRLNAASEIRQIK